MKLHTCFVTYNRIDLSKRAVESYLDTVSVPHTIIVVDNGSSDGTQDWLREWVKEGPDRDVLLWPENKYPGFACNRGWETAPLDADVLHRADNDFAFLPGWCEEVERAFSSPVVGQVGLRTDEEEQYTPINVGGNCALRRELWDQGLRYDERPWTAYKPGHSEDAVLSPAIAAMGYAWMRVEKSCIQGLASGDWNDPYYQRSFGDRKLKPDPQDPSRFIVAN